MNADISFLVKTPSTRAFRITFFLWCLLIVILRDYRLLVCPRFWAEEGTIFFSFAFRYSLQEILLTPLIGYNALFNAITAWLAVHCVPLEYAPFVTTFSGLLVILLPVAYIIFTDHAYWNAPLKKILIALMIILISPSELWLNTTNGHFYLGLTAFLIIVSDPPSGRVTRWFLYGILILASLSGPETIFFVPVLALRTWHERSRENIIRFILVGLCAVIQASLIIYSIAYDNRYDRLEDFNLLRFILRYFRDSFGLLLPIGYNDRKNISFAIAIISVWVFFKHFRKKEFLYFLISFLFIGIFSTLGSISMLGGARYSYIPSVIFLIMYSVVFFDEPGNDNKLSVGYPADSKWKNGRRLRTFFTGAVLTISLTFLALFFQAKMAGSSSMDYPLWKDEVANWRIDPSHRLRVPPNHPGWTWEVDLSD